jgi:hypothetical protein
LGEPYPFDVTLPHKSRANSVVCVHQRMYAAASDRASSAPRMAVWQLMRYGTIFAGIPVRSATPDAAAAGILIMLVFALVLLWLAACLGVISVWVLRTVSYNAPKTGTDAAEMHEPTTR